MIIVRVSNSGIGIFHYWSMKSWTDKEVIRCLNSQYNSQLMPYCHKRAHSWRFLQISIQIIKNIQSLLWFFPQRRKSKFVNWISEIGYFFSFVWWKGHPHQFFSVFKWKKKPLGFSENWSSENKTYLVKLCHFLVVSFYSEAIKVCAYPVTER